MKVKSSFAVVCLVCAAILIGGTMSSSEAANIRIPVAEFTTDGGVETAPGNFYKLFSGGYLVGGTNSPCFVAPVRLPNNATTIKKVIVYFSDTSAADSPFFQLDAIDMETGTVTNYTIGNVTTGTPTIQGIELPLSQTSLAKKRVYQLGTCLNSSEFFYGAKVVYSTAP